MEQTTEEQLRNIRNAVRRLAGKVEEAHRKNNVYPIHDLAEEIEGILNHE